MKILTTINCYAARNNGSAVFILAWKHFLDQHAKDIASDFLFINNGFKEDYFNNLVAPHKTYTLKCSAPQPFDTENTFWPIYHNYQNYDYIFRVDHDAFLSTTFYKSLLSFIEDNNEIDFITASNYPRPIEHNRDIIPALDNRYIPPEEVYKWQWLPWGYPCHNSDFFAIKTTFFKKCLDKYNADTRISSKKSQIQCPFHTNVLKYGEVCQTLNYINDKGALVENMAIHIDGSINSDFWTHMCASNMKMAGIVDNDNSFLCKNHMVMYGLAMNFDCFDNIIDSVNRSYPHKKTVSAPYFHMGNGYLSEWYFNPYSKTTKESFDYFANQFKSTSFGYYVAHYIVVRYLAASAGNIDLLNTLNNEMARVFAECKVNAEAFGILNAKIIAIYKGGMSQYLNEENIKLHS